MTQDKVTVTQADREAAQALCASGWTHAIEAFARHRQAAEAASRAEVERLREALRQIAEPINTAQCVGDPWDFYRDLQAVARAALSASDGEGV